MIFIYLALVGRIFLKGFEQFYIKKIKDYDPGTVSFWLYSLTLILYSPIAVYLGIDDVSFLPYVVIACLFYFIGYLLYVRAIQIEEISLVGPVQNFMAFFVLILGILLLGESFSFLKLGGVLLLFFGAYFLTSGMNFFESYKKLVKNKGVFLMLLSTFFIAFGRIIDGYVVQTVSPIIYIFFMEIVICSYTLAYLAFKKKLGEVKKMIKEQPGLTICMGINNAFSYLFLLIAFTAIEVSVAEPLSLMSAIVAIFLGKIFFGEKIKNRLVAALIMILGAWFLFM